MAINKQGIASGSAHVPESHGAIGRIIRRDIVVVEPFEEGQFDGITAVVALDDARREWRHDYISDGNR